MSLTIEFLGHAGLLLDAGSVRIAVDPFLSGSPVATKKAEDLACDVICISHGHADHYSDCLAIAKKNNATVFAAFEICEHLGANGHANTQPGNPGGRIDTDWGYVAFTQAFHSSSFQGQYMGQPCGLVINVAGKTIHHTGDTALFSDLKLIGEIYRPDVSFICAGDRFTMGPELASRAAELINPKLAVPIHWGTWPPLAQSMEGFKPTGIKTMILKAGETFSV